MRRWRLLVATGLLALAVAGAWRASQGAPASLDERVGAVTTSLRCPACEGQSVAASESDIARQMRQVARAQLAAGRTPEQVRAWFAERYGSSVLLDPPARGIGLVAVAGPVLALALGSAVLVRFLRGPGLRGPGLTAAVVTAAGCALVATVALQGRAPTGPTAPAGVPLPASTPALPLPPQAAAPAPSPQVSTDATVSSPVGLALAALKGGQPARAEQLAQAVLADTAETDAVRTDALLVLGLAQRQLGDPAAAVTLQTFLQQAPDHPAAAQVRSLLTAAPH